MLVLLTSTTAAAQTRSQGFALGAVGGWTVGRGSGALLGGAAGAEAMPNRWLGIGGEGALLVPPGSSDLLIAISADGRVRFDDAARTRTAVPFAGAGYTRLQFFDRGFNAWHAAGGIDYRLGERRGIRIEFRDIVRQSFSLTAHHWTVRVGVLFR